jgi:hypothetical protein
VIYVVVFLGSLAVDLVPVVAPPAWTVMAFLLVKYHLNLWLVLAAGVPGSALGRYLFSLYITKFSDKVMAPWKKQELRYFGAKLDRRLWQTWLFVFLYTLSPLSTSALFTAAAMTKVPVAARRFGPLSVQRQCGADGRLGQRPQRARAVQDPDRAAGGCGTGARDGTGCGQVCGVMEEARWVA